MMPEEWAEFDKGLKRHMRNLGFVPPEFQGEQRFALDDPPVRKADFPLTPAELQAIEDAAILCHRGHGDNGLAEAARSRGDYGGLTPEHFTIPDQRSLLQGGDNNPLD